VTVAPCMSSFLTYRERTVGDINGSAPSRSPNLGSGHLPDGVDSPRFARHIFAREV